MPGRISPGHRPLECEESGCAVKVKEPILLVDVEELLEKHSTLRGSLRTLLGTQESPKRCDCIVGYTSDGQLTIETIELKGSISWVSSQGRKALEDYARRIAEKHATCILLTLKILGPNRGVYRLGCRTLARLNSLIQPILHQIELVVWKSLRSNLESALQRARGLGVFDRDLGDIRDIRCYNWGRSHHINCNTIL